MGTTFGTNVISRFAFTIILALLNLSCSDASFVAQGEAEDKKNYSGGFDSNIEGGPKGVQPGNNVIFGGANNKKPGSDLPGGDPKDPPSDPLFDKDGNLNLECFEKPIPFSIRLSPQGMLKSIWSNMKVALRFR